MASSNGYKLLRNGTALASAAPSSLSNTGPTRRYAVSVDVPTPNPEDLGHRPFSEANLQTLAQRLRDPAWPLGAMNIYSLEGFLVALLVMPLGLRTRVWMPCIWNESGWKIPLALQVRETYDEFIELLFGFMRRIDSGFEESPPRFELVLGSADIRAGRTAGLRAKDWVHGFGQALSLCSHISLMPHSINRAALHAIASHAVESASASSGNGETRVSIQQAVLVLAKARISHGPLSAVPAIAKTVHRRTGAVAAPVVGDLLKE